MKTLMLAAMLALPINAYSWSETDYVNNLHKAEAYMDIYEQAAVTHGVPLSVLVRMGAIESGYWHPSIVSGKKRSGHGATGIAQFMPRTARLLKVNPNNPTSAINGQAKYLRMMYDQFKDWKYAVMAYNWGEGNLRKGLRNKRIPKSVKKYANFIIKEHYGK